MQVSNIGLLEEVWVWYLRTKKVGPLAPTGLKQVPSGQVVRQSARLAAPEVGPRTIQADFRVPADQASHI